MIDLIPYEAPFLPTFVPVIEENNKQIFHAFDEATTLHILQFDEEVGIGEIFYRTVGDLESFEAIDLVSGDQVFLGQSLVPSEKSLARLFHKDEKTLAFVVVLPEESHIDWITFLSKINTSSLSS